MAINWRQKENCKQKIKQNKEESNRDIDSKWKMLEAVKELYVVKNIYYNDLKVKIVNWRNQGNWVVYEE